MSAELVVSILNLVLLTGIGLLLLAQQKRISGWLRQPAVVVGTGRVAHHVLLSATPGHIDQGGIVDVHKPYPNYKNYRGFNVEVQVWARNQHKVLESAQCS